MNNEKQQKESTDLDYDKKTSQSLEPSAQSYDVPLGTFLPYTKVEITSDGGPADKRVGSIWLGRLVSK